MSDFWQHVVAFSVGATIGIVSIVIFWLKASNTPPDSCDCNRER